jgi:hypothetical protein
MSGPNNYPVGRESSQLGAAPQVAFYPLDRQREKHSAEKVEGKSDSTVSHRVRPPWPLDFGEVL